MYIQMYTDAYICISRLEPATGWLGMAVLCRLSSGDGLRTVESFFGLFFSPCIYVQRGMSDGTQALAKKNMHLSVSRCVHKNYIYVYVCVCICIHIHIMLHICRCTAHVFYADIQAWSCATKSLHNRNYVCMQQHMHGCWSAGSYACRHAYGNTTLHHSIWICSHSACMRICAHGFGACAMYMPEASRYSCAYA